MTRMERTLVRPDLRPPRIILFFARFSTGVVGAAAVAAVAEVGAGVGFCRSVRRGSIESM